MTHIVKGHGVRPDDQETFVPVGTKLRFYSDYDVDLNSNVSLVALLDGASAPAQETIEGTGKVGDVANYMVGKQDDEYIARWMTVSGESKVPILWVGSDIPDRTRLCATPGTCKDTHTCTGVLGRVTDTDIVILACRGVVGNKVPSEKEYGTDEDDPLQEAARDVATWAVQIVELATENAAAAEEKVDALPEGSLAMLMGSGLDFPAWMKARHVVDFAAEDDIEGLFGHLRANPSEGDRDRICRFIADCDYTPKFDAAVSKAVKDKPKEFLEAFEQLPGPWQFVIGFNPDVLAAQQKALEESD